MRNFLLCLFMPFISILVANAAFAQEGNGAKPAFNATDFFWGHYKKETKDACDKEFANSKLDPLRSKFPIRLLDDSPTDEMRSNENKPSKTERAALKALRKAEITCVNLMDADKFANDDKARRAADKRNTVVSEEQKSLMNGEITYAEYFRRQDQRRAKMIGPGLLGIDPKRYQNSIEAWLSPFKPNWPANSPLWDFYNYAIQVAIDVDGGKISDETAARKIEDKRLKVNQEIAALAAPKLVTLNCSTNAQNGQPDEVAITIDYTNMKVNGLKADFYENEIRWSYPSTDGSFDVHVALNRLSGFINFGSDQFPSLRTGHCAPATKQF